jgi:Family of unknown function (DUF5681)
MSTEKTIPTTERIPRKKGTGRFAKGTSGNPSGRPPGSRNQSTLLMEALLEAEGEQLTRKVIELALQGDILAMKLCLDRVFPARKDRPIQLSLPPVADLEKVASTMSKVVEAIGNGSITPGEGETLANVLAVQKDVLRTENVERRVEQLEQTVSHLKEEVAQETGDVAQVLREFRTHPEVNS